MILFQEFIKMVDLILENEVGLCTSDLSDIDYRAFYDDSMSLDELRDSAHEAAEAALYNEGFNP